MYRGRPRNNAPYLHPPLKPNTLPSAMPREKEYGYVNFLGADDRDDFERWERVKPITDKKPEAQNRTKHIEFQHHYI